MNVINKFFYFLHYNTTQPLPRTKIVKIGFYHLTFVLEGTLTYYADGKEYVLEKNDALLLIPGTYRERAAVPKNVRFVIINYSPLKGMEQKNNIFFKNAVTSSIDKLLDAFPVNMFKSAPSADTNDFKSAKINTILHNLCNCILIEIFDSLKHETENVHVNNALKYINSNILLPLTLDDVCRGIHLSKSYTSRVFKKEMNMTVTDYINKQKLAIAKNLLADDELPLREISSKLGYENYCYFSKIFKKEFGVPPIKMKE